jgi:ring-1,2-phenylacetyl-CoA epoxidase subunit PaaD
MVKKASLTSDYIWKVLDDVKDPEIPVVSVVEMGIVREVKIDGSLVQVTMTPTFTGCPALQVMQEEIKAYLLEAGAEKVEITLRQSPPWSSDWISEAGRAKLKGFGLAPPACHGGLIQESLLDIAACPYCDSANTSLKNNFGPTLCRAIFYCNNCQQPFEQFKPV